MALPQTYIVLGFKHSLSDRDVSKSKPSKLVNTKTICAGDFYRAERTNCACTFKQILKTCFGPLTGPSVFGQFTMKECACAANKE